MRSAWISATIGLALLPAVAEAQLNMDWAYHAAADSPEARITERVPGEEATFLANGRLEIADGEEVVIHVLTAHQFAGDGEEQVWLRWWNGEERWFQGHWQKNVILGDSARAAGQFRGLPASGEVVLDLWEIRIDAGTTRPGENYYVIQLKGVGGQGEIVHYLLREGSGEFGGMNQLGQAWTVSPDYTGRDWKVVITP